MILMDRSITSASAPSLRAWVRTRVGELSRDRERLRADDARSLSACIKSPFHERMRRPVGGPPRLEVGDTMIPRQRRTLSPHAAPTFRERGAPTAQLRPFYTRSYWRGSEKTVSYTLSDIQEQPLGARHCPGRTANDPARGRRSGKVRLRPAAAGRGGPRGRF